MRVRCAPRHRHSRDRERHRERSAQTCRLHGIAFLLEALISRYLPQELVAGALGRDTVWAVPLATLIGIPFYATNLSALGIVSGLLARGMSGAAALSFLIGGAVTTLPAMSAVWGIVKPRIFALYLGFCTGGALLAGSASQLAHALGATRGTWQGSPGGAA